MADDFKSKVEKGEARYASSGFAGKGFTFDDTEQSESQQVRRISRLTGDEMIIGGFSAVYMRMCFPSLRCPPILVVALDWVRLFLLLAVLVVFLTPPSLFPSCRMFDVTVGRRGACARHRRYARSWRFAWSLENINGNVIEFASNQ